MKIKIMLKGEKQSWKRTSLYNLLLTPEIQHTYNLSTAWMSFCVVSSQAFICRQGVSATCRRHVFGHVANTRKCCVGQKVEMTRHLKTCRDMSSNVCNNVIAFCFWAQTKKCNVAKVLVCLGWLELVGCYWYELGMLGPLFASCVAATCLFWKN